LIRVCLVVSKPFQYPDEENPRSSYANPAFTSNGGPGPFGYAQPLRPIEVRPVPGQSGSPFEGDDGELKLPPPPPAYRLWWQSVRVNPDGFFWVRREQQPAPEAIPEADESASRPPSYASRHREQFERAQEENQRLSQQAAQTVLPPHPSEVGRLPIRQIDPMQNPMHSPL